MEPEKSAITNKQITIAIAALVGLFLLYRIIVYGQCQSQCVGDCKAYVERNDPVYQNLKSYPPEQSLFYAQCQQMKAGCSRSCKFF